MQTSKFRGSFSSLEKALVLDLKIKGQFWEIFGLYYLKKCEKLCNKDRKNKEMNYRSHFGLCPFEDHHTKKMEEEKPEKKTQLFEGTRDWS